MRDFRIWLAGILLGNDLIDGRPLGSLSSQYDADSIKNYNIEKIKRLPRDVHFSARTEFRKPSIPEISRTNEGKFILESDSDEGGFTSRRRPARGVLKTRPWNEWNIPPPGIESGVYHVRQGTTTHLHPQHKQPAHFSLRSEGSGTGTYEIPRHRRGSPVYENSMMSRHPLSNTAFYVHSTSPQFGQHMIPRTSQKSILSPKGRLRSSSPGPLATQWRQLTELASFNEISSVRQPSSFERSFPSTVFSSFHNSNHHTPVIHEIPPESHPLYFPYSYPPYYDQDHPTMPSLYKYPNSRRFHIVGAQVHEPPARYRTRASYHPYYLPPPRYYSPWQPPHRQIDRRFGYISPQHSGIIRKHALLGSGQHIHLSPESSRILNESHNQSFVSDGLRHYVNIPSLRRNANIHREPPRRDPRYLLNPPPSYENQKPLATSSPPRIRPTERRMVADYYTAQHHAHRHFIPPRIPIVSPTTRHVKPPKEISHALPKETLGVKHKTFKRTRHHSAPNLSTSRQEDFDGSSKTRLPSDRKRRIGDLKSRSEEVSYELSNEYSEDQSPDSSSGFGSKNTSHQQSSSQSGQSLSALGLDTSRISEISIKNIKSANQPWEHYRLPEEPQIWPPPRLPPSYEQWLARQMQPQFRVPSAAYRYTQRNYGLPNYLVEPNPSIMPRTTNIGPEVVTSELENEVFDSNELVTIGPSISSPGAAALDISVDNHYEFDTMLSPTPIEDTLMPGSLELSSGGSGSNGNNMRRLSDSELYSTISSKEERKRRSQESMEERVAAMKQEFLEYRRRQAQKNSQTQLESIC